MNTSQTLVNISGYNNSLSVRISSTKPMSPESSRPEALRHTILMGAELGRQRSDNFRNTAFFETMPRQSTPVRSAYHQLNAIFRQAASDADNFATNYIAATYVRIRLSYSAHPGRSWVAI